MTLDQTLGVVFGLTLVLLGVGSLLLVYAPKSERLEALLSVHQTVDHMRALLLQPSDGVRVVDATEMTYTLSVPCRTGWFWRGGAPLRGTVFTAIVPLGFVAKLPDVDAVSKAMFIDATAVCLVPKLANQHIDERGGVQRTRLEILQRGRRWQILITGAEGQQVVTPQDVPVRAHVAVHTSIGLAVDDPCIATVFSDQRNYVQAVEAHAIRTFREFAARHTYAQVAVSTGELVDALNQGWADLLAGRGEQLPASAPLVTTWFSGVVVKLLVEQEEARLQPALRPVVDAERSLSVLADDQLAWIRGLVARFDNPYTSLDKTLEQFTGVKTVFETDAQDWKKVTSLERDSSGKKGFPARLRKELESNADALARGRDNPELPALAGQMLPKLQEQMEQYCRQVIDYADLVAKAIVELRAEERKWN